METQYLYGIVLTALPILISLSIHEFAHARTALAFGDPTAKNLGRCTLNPLAHLDPLGTLMMVFVGFGWAKPVPVNSANLNPPGLGNLSVSLAGPGSNVAMAAICAIVLRILASTGTVVDPDSALAATDVLIFLLGFMVLINIGLCMFNLIPLFPLDGHHVIREILPAHKRYDYMRWQVQYGRWVFLGLWIGPKLLHGLTGVHFSPLGTLLGSVVLPTCTTLLGPEAFIMTFKVITKFSGFLTWL